MAVHARAETCVLYICSDTRQYSEIKIKSKLKELRIKRI